MRTSGRAGKSGIALVAAAVVFAAAWALSGPSAAADIPKFERRTCLHGSEITYAIGQFGCGVALADWDGDGFTDIVAANGDGEVFVVPYDPRNIGMTNDPKGDLRLPGPTLIGKIPSRYPGADPVILEIADKNGDGKEDVVLRDRFGLDWLLLRVDRIKLGEAKPIGEPHKDWKRPAEFPRARGKLVDPAGSREVEVTGSPARFEVRWPNEKPYREGFWGFAWHGREGYDPNFAAADLDGDGRKDLVTVAVARTPGRSPRTVLFHKAIVDARLGLMFDEGRVLFDDAQVHNVVAAADLDGDGDYDVVLSRPGFHVLWNEGTKTEPKFLKKIKVEGVADEESVNLVDWDGDGLLDVVGSRWHDADHVVHLSFYRNLGRKPPELAFDKPVEILIDGKPVNMMSPGMCAVDFDGDGDLDLAFCPYGGAVQWAENTAGKGKPPMMAAPVPVKDAEGPIKCGTRNNAIRIVDLDGDGKLDLLLSTEYSGFDLGKEVSVWFGR